MHFKNNVKNDYYPDIDECGENEFLLCDQICVNTIGSYVCTCEPGFSLDGEECVGG